MREGRVHRRGRRGPASECPRTATWRDARLSGSCRAQKTFVAFAAGIAVVIAVSACGGEPDNVDREPAEQPRAPRSSSSAPEAPGETDGRGDLSASADRADPVRRRPSVKQAKCPAGAANCASATGRIVFVEAVDPDGDGDAHFVLLGSDSITAPGISVIDVRIDLRPDLLPGVGDLISAAGPVFSGSYDQSQIHADVLNVARR